MFIKIIILFLISLTVAFVTTYFTRRLSIKYRIGENADPRRMHQGFMPLLGGLGIFAGFVTGVLLSRWLFPGQFFLIFDQYFGLLIAAVLIIALGFYDDLKGLNAPQKFLGQFLIVSILILSGCMIRIIELPFGGTIDLGAPGGILVTYLWLIGVNNALNLLDGLDGLASGVSLIVSIVLALVAWQSHNYALFILILSLIAGMIGFLKFNYYPASIFMGDTGSLFLGLMVAVFSLKAFETQPGSIGLLAPIILLAIPIGDTSVALFRRLNKGHHPFKPDKDHLHHRLIYLGLSHRHAVHIIYLITILYAVTAYLIITQIAFLGEILLAVVIILSVWGLKRIGYLEAQKITTLYGDDTVFRVKREIAPLSIKRITHKLVLAISDILMLNMALFLTWWIRFQSGWFRVERVVSIGRFMFIPVMVLLTLGWILLFLLNDLYTVRWDVSRFDQIRQISKIILFGAIILFILTLDPNRMLSEGKLTLILYTLSLLVFVNLGRIFVVSMEKRLSILEYSPHKTLLIGRTEKGRKLLKDIHHNPHLLYDVVGYVSQQDEHKPFYGLQRLGSYDDIPYLIRTRGIEEIIIAINERTRDDILNIVARAMNMTVVFKIIPQMYDVVSGHKTEEVIGHPLIRLFPKSMRLWQLITKRVFDMVFSLMLILLLSPFALLIIGIQLVSGIHRPFIILNTIGKHGRRFGMLNFRTKREPDGHQPAIGRFLYRTRIYKLPALLNIFFGKMSFVGPRPDLETEVHDLEKRIKFYKRRFMVQPGMTGWAQVKYRYEEALKFRRDQLKQDLFYLENMSLSFDFRILLRSAFLFVFKREVK